MFRVNRQTKWMRLFAPVVWLAVFQVLVVSLLASSSDLHEHFHSDSHDSGHHCLSTDFQSGTVDQSVVAPLIAPGFMPVAMGEVKMPVVRGRSLPVHLCGSLLEHGPPAFA